MVISLVHHPQPYRSAGPAFPIKAASAAWIVGKNGFPVSTNNLA